MNRHQLGLTQAQGKRVETKHKPRRGKGQQKVTVEHVHVHSGGQAIVGSVTSPGGGMTGQSEEQPHAQQLGHASEQPMRSPDPEREAVPVTSDG